MPFKRLGKGAFGRLLSYALFVLGFWLLFQAFERPSPGLGILGGILVLLAMYSMVGFKTSPGRRHSDAFDEAGDEPGKTGGKPPEGPPPGWSGQ